MVARPGQAPKQTLAQQIAEFNAVPKAYTVTFDMSALTAADTRDAEELTTDRPEEKDQQESNGMPEDSLDKADLIPMRPMSGTQPMGNQRDIEGPLNPYGDSNE